MFIEQAQSCANGIDINPECKLYPEKCFCKPFLKERAQRANVGEVPVSLNGTINELFIDGIFRTAADALSSRLTTSECRQQFLSFLCGHFLKPCDAKSPDAIAIQPTASECKRIRDDVCFVEWRLLELSEYANHLPNCSVFNDTDESIDERLNIVCNNQFGLYCDSLCLPLCKEFSQNSEGITLLQDILFIFAAISSLLGGTFVIIIAIYRRNSM